MDSQGFAPSNLAPSVSGVPRRAPTRMDAGKSAIYTGNQVVHEKPDTDSQVIGVFKGIQGGTSALWLVQMAVMLPIGGLAGLFGWLGWKGGAFALRRWFQAPMNALFRTSVAEATSLPANAARSAADIARETKVEKPRNAQKPMSEKELADEQKAIQWRKNKVAELEGKTADWDKRGAGWRASIKKFFAETRAKVSAWLKSISSDNWFAKRMQSFTEWRVKRHAPKVEKSMKSLLEGGHEHAGLQSIFDAPEAMAKKASESGKALDTEKHAIAVEQKKIFQPVFDLVKEAMEAKDPTVRKQLLEKALAEVETIITTVTGENAKLAHGIRDGLKATLKTIGTLEHHVAALSAGLHGQVKNLLRIAGKIPVFYAIVGAGVAAGAVASALTAGRDNKLAKKAIKEMADDIGDANHPIVERASKLESKTAGRRWVSAGLNVAGDGAMLAPVNGAMGMVAIFGASQLPQLGQMMMPENQSLAAYMTLKKAEQGKLQLEPQQKVEMLRHLVTAVPAFSKHGGVNNALSAPVAVEIAKREMSVRDTMRFLANPDQFMKLVNDVAATQKKPTAPNASAASPQAASAVQAAKPALTIMAAQGTSQGRVVEAQRAVGQV